MLRILCALSSVLAVAAQYGDMNDVDRAMAGWDQLSKDPSKMQEVFQSFKDPEVMAKAQEMLKDPVYMEAAKRKVAQMQARAQAQGLLDSNGDWTPAALRASFPHAAQTHARTQSMLLSHSRADRRFAEPENTLHHAGMPVPGAAQATANHDPVSAALMAGAAKNAQAPPQQQQQGAREWELENIARHRAGEMNDAELGMANLKGSLKDPSVLAEMAQMLKDPENMAQLKQMMADPAFQTQAKAMAQQMKAAGELPDFSQIGQMAQAMRAQGGAGGAAAAEIARHRQENANLRAGI